MKKLGNLPLGMAPFTGVYTNVCGSLVFPLDTTYNLTVTGSVISGLTNGGTTHTKCV